MRRTTIERLGVGAACSVLAGALVFAAVRSDGYRANEVTLHDGSVWVTKPTRIGRYNAALELVDTQTPSFGAGVVDLLQVDDRVLLTTDTGKLVAIDVAQANSRSETTLPPGALVALGGQNGALLDPASSRLWFTDGIAVGSIEAAPEEPGAEVTPGFVELDGATDVVVGTDGAAHVLARASGLLWSLATAFDLEPTGQVAPDGPATAAATDGTTAPSTPTSGALADDGVQPPAPRELGGELADIELSTAGGRAIVLDRAGSRLLVDDGRAIMIPDTIGETSRLQLPSADDRIVLVAGENGLYAIDLESESITAVADGQGSGTIRPVRLRGCSFAAWAAGSVEACDDRPQRSEPTPEGWADPVGFRTNRGEIVLNFDDGNLLAYTEDGIVKIDNWEQALDPEADEDTSEELDDELEETDEPNPCEFVAGQNAAPIGVPDAFRVRAGRTVRLDVLSGVASDGQPDSDPDCDVLTLDIDTADPASAGIAVVENGRALQYTAPSEPGTQTFAYRLSDGASEPTLVSVAVDVVSDEQNLAPVANTDLTSVEAGKTVILDVLANDVDPELDPIVVASAVLDNPAGDTLVWQPNGRVSYTPPGGVSGSRTVTYQVSDARGQTSVGRIEISVLPTEGNQPPNTVDDALRGIAGQRFDINLLINDSDPNNDPLQLVDVTAYVEDGSFPAPINRDPGGAISFDIPAETFGDFNYVYTVSDGANEASGRFRLSVLPVGGEHEPIAVRDTAVLAAQKPTIVDVLHNDIDLDGDVLMITAVDLQGEAARDISAAIIDNRMIRLSANTAVPGQPAYDLRYTITDGYTEVVGSVEVAFSPASGGNSPIAIADEARAHIGGALSLPVLVNDFDPDGDPITLVGAEIDAEIYEQGDPGLLFVQGDRLRYLPPRADQRNERFTVTGTYDITDGSPGAEGRTARGRFRIEVTTTDDNLPPRPTVVELRVFEGETGTAQLPSFGIDPDGDVVTIDNIQTYPTNGILGDPAGTTIDYTPAPGYVGRDEFVLLVLDEPAYDDPEAAPGAVTVRVTVAPRRVDNPPVAVPDLAFVKPGTVDNLIPVKGNDQDAEGDDIVFADPAFDPPTGGTGVVRLADDEEVLVFDAPADEGTMSFSYYITDGKHQPVRGIVTVVVDDDAPNRAPLAKDDPQPAYEANSAPIEIDVLDNDTDPENDRLNIDIGEDAESLGVTILPAAAGSTDNPKLRVPIGETSLRFTYAVTDGFSTSFAVVTVPVLRNRAPLAEPATAEMAADRATLEIDVAQYLSDPDGDVVEVWRESRPETSRTEVFSDLQWAPNGDSTLVLTRNSDFTSGAEVLVTYQFRDVPDNGSTPKFATGSILVNVIANANTPPVVESVPVTVESGGTTTVNLIPFAYDHDPQDSLTFSLGGSAFPGGVTASVSDAGSVTITAPETAVAVGTLEFEIPYTASDGKDDGDRSAALQVTVTPSTAPGPRAIDDQMETIDQGSGPGTVDVVRNDVRSNQNVIKVIQVGLSPDGSTGIVDDRTVRFDPNPGFSGTTSFTYTIDDGREDVRFQSSATVLVSVRDRPDTPGRPTVGETTSARAVVSFTSPADNGAPIDLYQVRVSPGGRTVDCSASPCVVPDLANGSEYQFEVRARNAVDWSDWSEISAPYIPDEVPGRAPRPEVDWDDSRISIAWGAVPNNGSAVLDVRAVVTPAPPGGQPNPYTGGQSGGSITVTGLTNGTAYTVTLVARNRQGEGPIGDPSVAVTPVGPPILAGVVPAITEGNGEVTVSWPQPNGNGDNNLTYDVQLFQVGPETSTTTPVGTALSVTIPTPNAMPVRAILVVHNRYTEQRAGGAGIRSSASAVVVPFGVPRAITSVTATAPGPDGTVRLTFTAPSDEGRPITSYEFSVNNGGWTASPNGTSTTITVSGLALGPSYTFRVRGVNLRGPADPSPESGPAAPYRQPAAPTVSCQHTGGNNIQCSWTINALNGPGTPQVTVTGDTNQTSSPWNSGNIGYGQTRGVTVQVCNGGASGNCNSASNSARTPDPNPQVSTSRGSLAGTCDVAGVATCYWINISVSGMEPGAHTYRCFHGENIPGFGVRTGTINVDANGNGTASTSSGSVCYAATRNDADIDVNAFGTWVNDTGPGW